MSNSALWEKEEVIEAIKLQHNHFKQTITALDQKHLISPGKENGPQVNN